MVNRYKDGNDSIGFHKDDERDLCGGIVVVSLGAERDIIFKHQDLMGKRGSATKMDFKNEVKRIKITLQNGSLIVMKPPTNNYWYHSIPKRANVKNVRVSLTYRLMTRRKDKKKCL